MAASDDIDARVRLHLYRALLAYGHLPSLDVVAGQVGPSPAEVLEAFRRLADARAIVLGANADRVQVVPPFSMLPTPFVVTTGGHRWWGNCAWESLGIPALLGADATIVTASGAIGAPIGLEVRGGRVSPEGAVMHIAVPARQWWADIAYTCSTILFFASCDEVGPWCERHGVATGQTMSLTQAWDLANDWFGTRMREDWRRFTPDEAMAGFEAAGLHGEFWRL